MKKIILAVAFIVINLLINTNSVFAQKSGGGVTISPLTFELTANPGDVVNNQIKIYNPTDKIVSIKVEAEDFRAVGEEGKVVTTSESDEDTTYSLRKWIVIVPTEFTLESGKEKIVDFIIKVPENAEPGGKYGSILAGITGSISDGGTGAAIATKTGALVLLMVSGDLNEELIVSDFSAPSFLEYGPVSFEIKFENTGTVHVRPRGFIVVTDLFGKKVAELEFSQKNVLPGAIRKNEAEWDIKWLFGKYTATVVGNYGTGNIPFETRVITFWVLPWKLMLGVSLVLLFITVFFIKTKKRWKMALGILFKGEHHSQ